MPSNLPSDAGKLWSDKVFRRIPVGQQEPSLVKEFLEVHDFSPSTRRAFANDLRKFALWFTKANQEPFTIKRVMTRDVADFRDALRQHHNQAVATVNRALVAVRRFFAWLKDQGHVKANPVQQVKELRQVELAPKNLEQSAVRKLLREVELREDVRANAIFHMFLFTGCRCGDLVSLKLADVMISERSGHVVFRLGKGGKQRTVPLPLQARRALSAYLETRPPVESDSVFIGERGRLGDRGVRVLCDKYSALIGVKIHPHLLRHTFSHRYLEVNPGDLVGLAQILGHSNLNTTARYTRKNTHDLEESVDRIVFG